ALCFFKLQAFGNLVRDVLDADAQPAPACAAKFDQLVDNGFREVRRNGEADADRSARGRKDGRVDADDRTVQVEHRAAGIAAVDGGVGLDEIVIGAGVDIALLRGDNPRRYRATKPEG